MSSSVCPSLYLSHESHVSAEQFGAIATKSPESLLTKRICLMYKGVAKMKTLVEMMIVMHRQRIVCAKEGIICI